MSEKGPESYPKGLRRRNPDSTIPLRGKEMGPTRSQTLKSEAHEPARHVNDSLDLPPTGGFIASTTRDGRQTSIPSVGQYTLDGDQVNVDQIQTTREMKKLQSKDALALEVPDGTPPPKSFRKADAQMRAITAETLRRAERRKKEK